MKLFKNVAAAALILAFVTAPAVGFAAEGKEKPKKETKAKPYPLPVCVVSGEKLGEMGKTYTFTHQGREVKLCCKSCLKDFQKEPAKYVKKMEEAEKGAHKKQSGKKHQTAPKDQK